MANPHVGGLLRFTGRMRRLGWGVADQGVSSITNFALVFLVAHSLKADSFGAFSLAYATYAFTLNVSRSVSSYPLQVRFSGAEISLWRRAVASSSGTALIVGFASGLVVLAASLVMTGSSRSSFTALGLALPGLLLQDSWRYAFFALSRGSRAFFNDAIWAVAQLPAMVLLHALHVNDVFWFVLAWGGSAAFAAVFGILQARIVPQIFSTMAWLIQHRDLASRYTLLDIVSSGATQLATYAVSGVVGLAVIGYIRAATTLMGPFQIMYFGISLVTVPEAVRLLRTSPGNLVKFCQLISAGLGVAALSWGGILLAGMPHGLGRLALGAIWLPTYPLVPFQVAIAVLQGSASGAATGLNALGAVGRNLRANLIGVVCSIVFAVAGAYAAGGVGVMAAGVLGNSILAIALWWELRSALTAAGISAKGNRSLLRSRRQLSVIHRTSQFESPAVRPDQGRLRRELGSVQLVSGAVRRGSPRGLSFRKPSAEHAWTCARRGRKVPVSKAPRVGLLGLLGTGNLGNDVSMEAVLRYLRTEHPAAVVDVMGKGPETITDRYGVPAVFMNWYQRYEKTATGIPAILLKSLGKVIDVPRTAAWVRRHDVVIIPGMGTMEASLPLKSSQLPYSFLIACTAAKVFGVKVAFVSIGAGVVKRQVSRFLLDASAKLAAYRSYRDATSRDRLRERGVDTSRDHVYADLAFGIPALPCGPGDPNVVGVGVMGYRGSDDDRKQADEIYAAYIAAVKSFVRWLVDNGRHVRIMIGDEAPEDISAGQEVLADVRAYRPDLAPGQVEAVYATTFHELMEVMAPTGTVVATRFHSVVCALRLGKPVVALSYAQKFTALLGNMGLTEFMQPAKFPDRDVLVEQFTELENRQDELRKAIAEGNAGYEQSVADQFAELSVLLRALTPLISPANSS